MKASTVLSGLSPAQRDSLLAIQPDATRRALGATSRPTRGARQGAVETTARAEGGSVVVFLKGLVLVSEANTREHWTVKHQRRCRQQRHVALALASVAPCSLTFPVEVLITRLGPRALDTDNLQGSAKAVRDELARWLGVDDGPSAPVSWHVAQVRGPYGCRIELTGGA